MSVRGSYHAYLFEPEVPAAPGTFWYTGAMAYREVTNVVSGTKAQLEACVNALDRHEDPPAEIEALTTKLEEATQLCDLILGKAEAEEKPAE